MKKSSTGIEILIVILVLGIFTIANLTSTSHSFKDDTQKNYENTKYLIEQQAIRYGNSLEELPEEYTIITLEDLIQAGYFATEEDGTVSDPRNSKATLNNLKIKIYLDENQIKANVLEE